MQNHVPKNWQKIIGKDRTYYYLILFLLLLIPYLDFKNFILKPFTDSLNLGIVSTTSDLIQAWLLVVGSWVAYETLRLRYLTSKQIEIQIAPVLLVYFREKQDRITIRNIGNGPAFSIQFESIDIYLEDIKKTIRYSLGIDDPPVLVPQEEREITGKMTLEGKQILNTTSNLKPKYATLKFEFSITYEDMEQGKYESKVSTSKEGVKLLSFERKS